MSDYLVGPPKSGPLTGNIFTQTANKVVTNTVTETSLIGTGVGVVTFPANFMAVGKTFRFRNYGFISTAPSAGTSRLRIKFGSTVILDSNVQTIVNGLANDYVELESIITCRSIGATGTVIGQALTIIHSGSGINTLAGRELVNTSPVTIDTTQPLTFDETYQWGTADAGNILTITNATLEVLN